MGFYAIFLTAERTMVKAGINYTKLTFYKMKFMKTLHISSISTVKLVIVLT